MFSVEVPFLRWRHQGMLARASDHLAATSSPPARSFWLPCPCILQKKLLLGHLWSWNWGVRCQLCWYSFFEKFGYHGLLSFTGVGWTIYCLSRCKIFIRPLNGRGMVGNDVVRCSYRRVCVFRPDDMLPSTHWSHDLHTAPPFKKKKNLHPFPFSSLLHFQPPATLSPFAPRPEAEMNLQKQDLNGTNSVSFFESGHDNLVQQAPHNTAIMAATEGGRPLLAPHNRAKCGRWKRTRLASKHALCAWHNGRNRTNTAHSPDIDR